MSFNTYSTLSLCLTALGSFLAVSLVSQADIQGIGWVCFLLSVAIPLGEIFLLGWRDMEGKLKAYVCAFQSRRLLLLIFCPTISYVFYLSASPLFPITFSGIILLFCFTILPGLMFLVIGDLPQKLTLYDVLALGLMLLPLQHQVIPMIWKNPEGLNIAYFHLFIVIQGYISFGIIRGLSGIGFCLVPTRQDILLSVRIFFILCGCVIPLGLGLGFLEWKVSFRWPWELLLTFIGYFIGVALPEELFFRGIIQNLLQKTLQHQTHAVLVASILFGLAHIKNGWNGSFVFLAVIVGIFYGWAYLRSGRLFAPTFLHALVGTTWVHFLHG